MVERNRRHNDRVSSAAWVRANPAVPTGLALTLFTLINEHPVVAWPGPTADQLVARLCQRVDE